MKTCLLCECTSAGTAVTFRRRHICTDCERDLARRGLGWCTRGRHKAPLDELRHVPAWCRACAAAARAARYAAAAEAERERTRRYYAAHRAAVQARMYAQRRAHPEARRAAQRRYYWRHRAAVQDYRARTRETRQAVRRQWQQLTQHGNASKALMMTVARSGYGVAGEHAADALGVAMCAIGRVQKETVR